MVPLNQGKGEFRGGLRGQGGLGWFKRPLVGLGGVNGVVSKEVLLRSRIKGGS